MSKNKSARELLEAVIKCTSTDGTKQIPEKLVNEIQEYINYKEDGFDYGYCDFCQTKCYFCC